MKIKLLIMVFVALGVAANAQVMTPKMLWELNRVSPVGITDDGNDIIYYITKYDVEANAKTSKIVKIPILGGEAVEIEGYSNLIKDSNVSPNGEYRIDTKEFKLKPVVGTDFYPELDKSNMMIFDNLNYRHWDTWEDGKYSHVVLTNIASNTEIDIMQDEPYDCPQMPFGGAEDYTWNHDGSKVLYVTKKEYGTAYAVSTNSDIYAYDLATKATTNLTAENKGYDTQPAFSKEGVMAWKKQGTKRTKMIWSY